MPKIHVNNIDIYYESVGEGPPILLIHGLGSSTRDWEYQVEALAKDYQVILFDVRGHGQSDKPPGPYSLPLFANDTAEFIRELGIAPAHVVGISMGGMIAFQLAVRAPELVRSMVVVNAGPEFLVQSFQDRMSFFQRRLIVRLLNMRKMGEVLSKRLFIKPEQEDIRQQFVERWAENDPNAYMASMNSIVNWSVADHLGDIKCPVLVVAADEDYTPVAQKEAFVSKMVDAEMLVFKDSRHATPVEYPEQFNEAVLDFLSKQD